MENTYQQKYLKHQIKKRLILTENKLLKKNKYTQKEINILLKIIKNRKSHRIFKNKINDKAINEITAIGNLAPSSCNRHGIIIKKAPKSLIKMLVGGKGWCDKGTVIAFYADIKCYKSEYEKEFMPYLDTGFIAQNIYLYCEAKGLRCCFINPNTHNKYKSAKLLCGSMAIGK